MKAVMELETGVDGESENRKKGKENRVDYIVNM